MSFLELFPTAIAWELLVLLTSFVFAFLAWFDVLRFPHVCYHVVLQIVQVLKSLAANSTRMNIYGCLTNIVSSFSFDSRLHDKIIFFRCNVFGQGLFLAFNSINYGSRFVISHMFHL